MEKSKREVVLERDNLGWRSHESHSDQLVLCSNSTLPGGCHQITFSNFLCLLSRNRARHERRFWWPWRSFQVFDQDARKRHWTCIWVLNINCTTARSKRYGDRKVGGRNREVVREGFGVGLVRSHGGKRHSSMDPNDCNLGWMRPEDSSSRKSWRH